MPTPAELIEAHRRRLEAQQEIPEGISAHELLQMEYRGQIILTPAQRRSAIECLPYETPKLTAVALTAMSGADFAARLDRAIARSGKVPLLIEAKAVDNSTSD